MNTSINYATLLCNLAPIYRILSVYDVVKSEDDARENSSEIGSIRVVRRRPYRWWLQELDEFRMGVCELDIGLVSESMWEKVQGETLNGWGSRRQLHAVAFPPAHCRGWWQCDILYTSLNRWFFNILRHILPFICSRGLASLKVKCLFARRQSVSQTSNPIGHMCHSRLHLTSVL